MANGSVCRYKTRGWEGEGCGSINRLSQACWGSLEQRASMSLFLAEGEENIEEEIQKEIGKSKVFWFIEE